MERHCTRPGLRAIQRASGTALALRFTAWLIAAWTGAWLMSRRLEEHVCLMQSDLGQCVYGRR